jgi:hypothetical protein
MAQGAASMADAPVACQLHAGASKSSPHNLRMVGPPDQKLVARRMARRMARQRRQSLADQVRGAAAGTRIALVGSLTAAPGKEAQSGAKSLGCQ